MKLSQLLILVLLVFAIGCSKKNKKFDLVQEPIETLVEVQPDIVDPVVIEDKEIDPVITEDPYTPIDGIIYFNFDSDELTQESIDALDAVRRNIRPNAELVITGETCPIGEEIYNYKLGLRRAKSVWDYLNKFLKDRVDMVCASNGEGSIVNRNPDEYDLNRRAVIEEQVKKEY